MANKKLDRKIRNILFLLATFLVSLVPLYITRFHGAIEDGGLLLISSVFAADALMRCFQVKRTTLGIAFAIGALVFGSITTSEYAPIAARLVKQDQAVTAWLRGGDPRQLGNLRRNALEEPRDQDTVPNDSRLLLLCSLLVDIGVILIAED